MLYHICTKFLWESWSERIGKFGLHLVKLRSTIKGRFWDTTYLTMVHTQKTNAADNVHPSTRCSTVLNTKL